MKQIKILSVLQCSNADQLCVTYNIKSEKVMLLTKYHNGYADINDSKGVIRKSLQRQR